MTTYLGEFKFNVSGCDSEDAFEAHIDQVLDFLLEDDRLIDPDYTATLAKRVVEFALSVEADDEADAFQVLHTALRSAIHAAEGCTPGWENSFRQVLSSLRESKLVDA